MQLMTLPERFGETSFDAVIIGDEKWLRGPQIGAALGLADPTRAVQKIWDRNQSEFDDSTTMVVQIPTGGGRQLVRLYSARGAALIAMKAKTARAEAFRRWVLDVLEGVADQSPVAPGEMPAGVRNTLQAMFVQRKGNTALIRYRQMGLGPAEIAKLLGVGPRSVNPRLRVAEFLGLTEPPADLEFHRTKGTFQKMMEGKRRAQLAYQERQRALAAPQATEATDA